MPISNRIAAGLLGVALFLGLPLPGVIAGTLTALGSFSIEAGDHPYAMTIFDNVVGRQSALYTTASGGAGTCYESYGCGAVIEFTPPATVGGAWTAQTVHAFTGADGDVPFAGLIFDTFGALYGTAAHGGAAGCYHGEGCGTVFKLTPPSTPGGPWTETTLYKFAGGVDGESPTGNLVFDTFGSLYGTTFAGGPANCGVIYKLTPPATQGGAWTKTALYSFSGADGCFPQANLIFDTAGALYATTQNGGALDQGVVFKLTPPATPGGAWTEALLHTFAGGADGAIPYNALMFDTAGALYGTTWKGGSKSAGIAFKLIPPTVAGGVWSESIYEFDGVTGSRLQGGLTRDTFGVLYGTTNRGGTGNCNVTNCGTVFALVAPATLGGAWTHTVLANFTGPNGGDPEDTPTFHLGSLYGTGDYGGANDLGVVFQFTP
jgi:uncharacterized repeat protein (TIGR03803 family)